MAWRGTVVAPVLTHWNCCSLALCHQDQYANCFIHMLPFYHGHIDGLAWNCGSSSADALKLLQSRAGPSVWTHELFYTSAAMSVSMDWSRTVLDPVPMHWSCHSLALGHWYEHTGWFIHLLPCRHVYIRGLVRNCSTSSADALELPQSCAGSSVWVHKLIYTSIAMAYMFVAMSILVSWCGTGVAPVLMHSSCCSLALGHQCECMSFSVHLLSSCHFYADGLAWDCGSSSADALELLKSCAGPFVRVHGLLYASVIMLSFSCWWLGVELWWLQCWRTGIAAVLRWAIKMSSQFGQHVYCHGHIDALQLLQSCAGPSVGAHQLIYVCCHGPMFILMV